MSAAFLGIIDISFKTFTAAYAPVTSPWVFNNTALQPMEFAGYIGPGPAFGCLGFGGAVFDDLTGATKFTVGQISGGGGAFNNNFGSCVWFNNKILGWSFGIANSPFARTFGYTVPLDGSAHTYPTFTTGASLSTPNGSPNQYSNANYLTYDGKLYCSYTTGAIPSFNQQYAFWDFNANTVDPGTGFIYPFTPDFLFGNLIPYAGINWINTGYFGIGLTKYIVRTDLRTFSSSQTMTIVNPPAASIDINAAINAQTGPQPSGTYKGLLWIFTDVLTIGAKTLNGYGVLTAPDFSGYYILNFIPTDVTSAGWRSLLGDYGGKIDQHGIIWMKAGGNASIIFKSLPTPANINQVFPPMGLPSPPDDTEIMLLAYRGT